MKMTDEKFWRFVEEHALDDCAKLRLKYNRDPEIIKAIEQIELRKKSPDKFIGTDGRSVRPRFLYSSVSVEQSTSAAIANFHASVASECRSVLDMTMGIGMDAMAFCSNGAEVVAIEMNRDLCETSRMNYQEVGGLNIINGDSVEWLKSTERTFDCIFIDPARRDASGCRVCNIHDCSPDVIEILPLVMAHTSMLMVKLSPMLDISATIRDLPGIRELYVVEERGECRELLAVIRKESCDDVTIVARNGCNELRFTQKEESAAVIEYGIPVKGNFFYEPSPSVMKAGPFKLLGQRFGLKKIAPNSHLYFGYEPEPEFPGKCYEIEEVLPYSSSVLKRFCRKWPKVSVAVRNFPDTADRLRSRLKVKESSELRLMATTAYDGEKMLFLLKHPCY